MAKPLPLPTIFEINPGVLTQLRQTFGSIYDEESHVIKGREIQSQRFLNLVHSPEIGVPESLSIKQIGITLQAWYEIMSRNPEHKESLMKGAPDYPVSKTSLTSQESEQLIESLEKWESEFKETKEKTEAEIQASIDRQKQIYDEKFKAAKAAEEKLQGQEKNLYVSQEKKVQTEEQQKAHEKFVNEVKKDPEQASQTIAADIKSRVGDDIPDTVVQFAAVYIVANAISDNKPAMEAAAAQSLKDNPEFKDIGDALANQKLQMHELAQIVADRAYGQGNPFVPTLGSFKTSESVQEGYSPVSYISYAAGSEEIFAKQQEILSSPETSKPDFMVSELDRQLKLIKAGGIQGAERNFSTSLVQGYTATFSPNPSISTFGLDSKLSLATGGMEPFGLIGRLATKKALGKVGAQIAAKTGLKALIPEIGGAVGAIGGPLGIAISYIGTEILSRINWAKIKKYFFVFSGAVAAVLGYAFAVPALAIGGLAVGGVGLAAAQGITAAGIGRGIVSFAGALASATLGAIGIPILVTLLAFPVAVVIILFIINSGAYIVPPGTSTGVVGLTCSTAENGDTTDKALASRAANAAVCIVSYLNKFHINPLLVSSLGSSGWNELTKVLPPTAIDALEASAHVDNHLQCVGFTAATAAFAYGQAFGQINACSYINNAPAGYRYVSGTRGIKSGDFFVIDGSGGCSTSSPGHIGVVLSVDGALISCADANYTAPGQARVAHGCFALSQITGYLSK